MTSGSRASKKGLEPRFPQLDRATAVTALGDFRRGPGSGCGESVVIARQDGVHRPWSAHRVPIRICSQCRDGSTSRVIGLAKSKPAGREAGHGSNRHVAMIDHTLAGAAAWPECPAARWSSSWERAVIVEQHVTQLWLGRGKSRGVAELAAVDPKAKVSPGQRLTRDPSKSVSIPTVHCGETCQLWPA